MEPKEDIILIKPIKRGCYSDNLKERDNSGGGFLMRSGATYTHYPATIKDGKETYPAYYRHGTHIIYERDIDWDSFIVASKYQELISKMKKEIENVFTIIRDKQTPAVPPVTDVKKFITENKKILNGLVDFAAAQPTAFGLAANQCACNGERINLRAFAHKDLNDGTWSLAIDPSFTPEVKATSKKIEGCLTWKEGGRNIVADRFFKVKVKYFDEEGNPRMQVVSGLEAQLWQHEINHLNGVEEEVVNAGYVLSGEKPIGRNDLCPCESGLKWKKCCMNN